jgi:hypothetical protein
VCSDPIRGPPPTHNQEREENSCWGRRLSPGKLQKNRQSIVVQTPSLKRKSRYDVRACSHHPREEVVCNAVRRKKEFVKGCGAKYGAVGNLAMSEPEQVYGVVRSCLLGYHFLLGDDLLLGSHACADPSGVLRTIGSSTEYDRWLPGSPE